MMMMMVVIIMTITSVFVSHLYSEKLGYFSSNPGDSCKHIRDVEDSSGDGEYWIDPEKNGNPLKVFCDMTTDGGTSCKKHVRKTLNARWTHQRRHVAITVRMRTTRQLQL